MHELGERVTNEIDWRKVLRDAIEKNIRIRPYREKDRLLSGRVFEDVCYRALSYEYLSPGYTITKPGETAHIKKLMSQDEDDSWHPNFPDSLILQHLNRNVTKLVGIAEYKMTTPFLFYGNLRNQFEGFTRLVNFLRQNEARRGREILEELLRRRMVKLEIPQDVKFIYVVPLDKTAKWIPTKPSAVSNFQEKQIPLTSKVIKREIGIYKRKNPQLFPNQ